MAVYKCKMCGSTLEITEGASTTCCEYCNTTQTLPKITDELTANLFNRANTLRIRCEFDKALELYEKIIADGTNDAEAYWGLILCKYGIEYVDDPKSKEKVPTCHRAQVESVLSDMDYKMAMEYADVIQKELYEKEAKAIDTIQKGILEIAQKEEPFDVFICYKETDSSGQRTNDSVIANDIYYKLKGAGFKVFYAAITLEDKVGQEYEPYIFAALNSAKVMLVVGSKTEYFNAVWVKNEWSRFLKIMAKDRSRLLIPCYKDIDAYDLPEEFAHFQAQNMGKIGFIEDLIHGIKKVIKKEDEQKSANREVVGGVNIGNLLKRARIFLKDGDYESANSYAEKVLDVSYEVHEAYMVKALCSFKCVSEEQLYENYLISEIEKNGDYSKALQYAKPDEKVKLDEIKNTTIYRIANQNIEEGKFVYAIGRFNEIIDYSDCKEKIEDAKNKMYVHAQELLTKSNNAMPSFDRNVEIIEDLKRAIRAYDFLGEYEDSVKLKNDCYNRIKEVYNWEKETRLDSESFIYDKQLKEAKEKKEKDLKEAKTAYDRQLTNLKVTTGKRVKTARILHLVKLFFHLLSVVAVVITVLSARKVNAEADLVKFEKMSAFTGITVGISFIVSFVLHIVITKKQKTYSNLLFLNFILLCFPSFIFTLVCLLSNKYGAITTEYKGGMRSMKSEYDRNIASANNVYNTNVKTAQTELTNNKEKIVKTYQAKIDDLQYGIDYVRPQEEVASTVIKKKSVTADADYLEEYSDGYYIRLLQIASFESKLRIVKSIKDKTGMSLVEAKNFAERGGILDYDFGDEDSMYEFAELLVEFGAEVDCINEGYVCCAYKE